MAAALPSSSKEYLELLKQRGKRSRIYKSYQMTGLEIANVLNDWEHKSLYIKLAKEKGEAKMMWLAKNVADLDTVENRGAYFMKLLQEREKSG